MLNSLPYYIMAGKLSVTASGSFRCIHKNFLISRVPRAQRCLGFFGARAAVR
jgi:hypothetical protein